MRSSKGKYAADSSSSSDSSVPPRKRLKQHDYERDIIDIKGHLMSLFTIQQSLKLPFSLRLLFVDSFKCCICQDMMEPPVIFSRCCKSLIGCEKCVDAWYEGDRGLTKTCPRCRAERALSETCRFNGFDELLTGIKKLINDIDDQGSSTS